MKQLDFLTSDIHQNWLWNVKDVNVPQNPEQENEKPDDSKDPLKESQDAEEEAKKLEDPKKKENVEGGEAGKADLGKVEGNVKNVGDLKEVEYKSVNGRTVEVDVSEKNAAEATREAHRDERQEAARAKAELAKEMKLHSEEAPETEEPKNPELAKVEKEQTGEEEKAKGEEEKDMAGVQENADTWLKESGVENQDTGVGTNVG